jgi:hypothetical protein
MIVAIELKVTGEAEVADAQTKKSFQIYREAFLMTFNFF